MKIFILFEIQFIVSIEIHDSSFFRNRLLVHNLQKEKVII